MGQSPHNHGHAPPNFAIPPKRPPGSRDVLIGDAGVHLTMSRLLSWCIPARDSSNGVPYDIIADVPGTGMIRIQVKTTTRVKNGKIGFRMQRGFHRSRRGTFDYQDTDFDVAAFVYLPKAKLIFCASPRRSLAFPAEWLDVTDVEHRSWLYSLRHHDEAVQRRAKRSSQAAPAETSSSPKDDYSAGPRRTFFSPDESYD